MDTTLGKKLVCKVAQFLSGYTLAVLCLVMLFVLTWLSTLEQPEKGLYIVQQRYYSASSWFVSPDLDFIPKIRGNSICPPIPSAYLVSVVLFVNLTLGGLIRIRKNWKKWGVILSHFSMVGLLVAGFVSHHYSREGLMLVYEGDQSDYAQSYTEFTIEVAKYKDGVKQAPYVIPSTSLMDMHREGELSAEIPPLGITLEISNWISNAELFASSNTSEIPHLVKALELNPTAEANQAACKVNITGAINAPTSLQLHGILPETKILISESESIGIRLIKEVWKMPFHIKLDSSKGEYHPNTNRPRYFESQVTKLEKADSEKGNAYTIKMNEPLRHGGYTLYQAKWLGEAERAQSGFAVVSNPADQWPKYCLYISLIGLTAHFGMQLGQFLLKRNTKNS